MPMWRCPHCGTPQAESSRCWVCKRSSTSCGTCRHFRRAIAGQLGYCGLDRHRLPLRGDEIRGCWESTPESLDVTVVTVHPGHATSPGGGLIDERPRLDFVPVERPTAARRRQAKASPAPSPGSVAAAPTTAGAPRDPRLGFWSEEP